MGLHASDIQPWMRRKKRKYPCSSIEKNEKCALNALSPLEGGGGGGGPGGMERGGWKGGGGEERDSRKMKHQRKNSFFLGLKKIKENRLAPS